MCKRNLMLSAIDGTNGKIFNVWFIKKDGTLRRMTARIGVTNHLKGGKSTTEHKNYLRTVFDMEKGQYRSVNLETIQRFKCGDIDLSIN